MARDLITLRPESPLAQAAGVFLHEQISGAPVVDAGGVCVGVLSVSDILEAEERLS
jgi:predicted transcriptional regulator